MRPLEAVTRVAVPERSEKTEIKSSNTKDLCKQFEHSQSPAINSVSCKKRDDKEEKSPSASQRGESDPPGGGAAGRWTEIVHLLLDCIMTGSLAGREGRKWIESVVGINNNPSSGQTTTRREKELSPTFLDLNWTQSSRASSQLVPSDQHQKIYCGLRSVNAARYNRDYFINNGSDERVDSRDISFTPEEAIDCEKVTQS